MDLIRIQMETVPAYDGAGGTTRAAVAYHTVTGRALAVARKRPFESNAGAIARANAAATLEIA